MHETENDRRLCFSLVNEEIRKAAEGPKPISRRGQLQPYPPEFRPRLYAASGGNRSGEQSVSGSGIILGDPLRGRAQLALRPRGEDRRGHLRRLRTASIAALTSTSTSSTVASPSRSPSSRAARKEATKADRRSSTS